MSTTVISKLNSCWRYISGTYFIEYMDEADDSFKTVLCTDAYKLSPSVVQFSTSYRYEKDKRYIKFSWKKYAHDLGVEKEHKNVHSMFDSGKKMPTIDYFVEMVSTELRVLAGSFKPGPKFPLPPAASTETDEMDIEARVLSDPTENTFSGLRSPPPPPSGRGSSSSSSSSSSGSGLPPSDLDWDQKVRHYKPIFWNDVEHAAFVSWYEKVNNRLKLVPPVGERVAFAGSPGEENAPLFCTQMSNGYFDAFYAKLTDLCGEEKKEELQSMDDLTRLKIFTVDPAADPTDEDIFRIGAGQPLLLSVVASYIICGLTKGRIRIGVTPTLRSKKSIIQRFPFLQDFIVNYLGVGEKVTSGNRYKPNRTQTLLEYAYDWGNFRPKRDAAGAMDIGVTPGKEKGGKGEKRAAEEELLEVSSEETSESEDEEERRRRKGKGKEAKQLKKQRQAEEGEEEEEVEKKSKKRGAGKKRKESESAGKDIAAAISKSKKGKGVKEEKKDDLIEQMHKEFKHHLFPNYPIGNLVEPSADIKSRSLDPDHLKEIKSKFKEFGIIPGNQITAVVFLNDLPDNIKNSIRISNNKVQNWDVLMEAGVKAEVVVGNHRRAAMQALKDEEKVTTFDHYPVLIFFLEKEKSMKYFQLLQRFGTTENQIASFQKAMTDFEIIENMRQFLVTHQDTLIFATAEEFDQQTAAKCKPINGQDFNLQSLKMLFVERFRHVLTGERNVYTMDGVFQIARMSNDCFDRFLRLIDLDRTGARSTINTIIKSFGKLTMVEKRSLMQSIITTLEAESPENINVQPTIKIQAASYKATRTLQRESLKQLTEVRRVMQKDLPKDYGVAEMELEYDFLTPAFYEGNISFITSKGDVTAEFGFKVRKLFEQSHEPKQSKVVEKTESVFNVGVREYRFINANAINQLNEVLPPGHYSIIEMDPPYSPNLGNTRFRDIFTQENYTEIFRVLKYKNQKTNYLIISFIDTWHTAMPFKNALDSVYGESGYQLDHCIWHKTNASNSGGNRLTFAFESFALAYIGGRQNINWNKLNFSQGSQARHNVIALPEVPYNSKHSIGDSPEPMNTMEKPVWLYYFLLSLFGTDLDRTLSICSGSGSFALACWFFKCSNISIEIDPIQWEGSTNRFEVITTDKTDAHQKLIEPAVNYLEDLKTTRSFIASQKFADYLATCREARKKINLKNTQQPHQCSVCLKSFKSTSAIFTCGLATCTSLFHPWCCKSDCRNDRVMYCGTDCKKEDEGSFNPPARSASAPPNVAAVADVAALGLTVGGGDAGGEKQ